MSSSQTPKLGPEPVLLSRKQVDALYETFQHVIAALGVLDVDFIITGGSLLGAVRQHSLLFCDDDIDIAIVEYPGSGSYEKVANNLQALLGPDFLYQQKPWEAGDKVRPKRTSNVFLDIFCLRRYDSLDDLKSVIGVKRNGKPQSEEYVQRILSKLETSAYSQGEQLPLAPFWQFDTRKAVEMWPKEVYREHELFPLRRDYKFGPLDGIQGPQMPVTLLKRSFGVDCFEVYYQSATHQVHEKQQHNADDAESGTLQPIVAAGGTWESATKMLLHEEHYLPMQPVARAKRRPTLHGRESLMEYLAQQSAEEEGIARKIEASLVERTPKASRRPRCTVYMDGVFDLFHVGHLEAIRQCAAIGDRVIIGITGDADAAGYKRRPIISQADRVAVVEALAEVDKVVCPCPLVVTEDFMNEHDIDLVVHGFANDADAKRQEEFFKVPMEKGCFKRIGYYEGLSTSDIIEKAAAFSKAIDDEPTDASSDRTFKPQWFGAALAAATADATEIPYDPFPLHLRQVVDRHIRKAVVRREDALKAIRQATGDVQFQKVMGGFQRQLGREEDISFEAGRAMLRESFLQCTGLTPNYDLSQLHKDKGAKDLALFTLTKQYLDFQETFDQFVRQVCAPQLASKFGCDEIYYQAFPCVRLVQPNEFSIGPHCDVAYGHHPCSVNFYVPLTPIRGSSSLFLESRPGSEDWHPIEGDYGIVKQFAGAMCIHWTTENKTGSTRASLDFRLIPGPLFRSLSCGGSEQGGQRDVYRAKDGYYSKCQRQIDARGQRIWQRSGPLMPPDARVGFPFTIKDWDRFWKKSGESVCLEQ